jgi:hypothetical protein
MTPEEAREVLYGGEKDTTVEPWLYDRMLEMERAGELAEWGFRLNEFGEFVVGGGLMEGDTAPTFRYSRAKESA